MRVQTERSAATEVLDEYGGGVERRRWHMYRYYSVMYWTPAELEVSMAARAAHVRCTSFPRADKSRSKSFAGRPIE